MGTNIQLRSIGSGIRCAKFKLSNANDKAMTVLVAIDQARVAAENIVNDICSVDGLYRNEIKKSCRQLYFPKGKSYNPNAYQYGGGVFKGWACLIGKKMLDNMTEEEQSKFSLICDDVDQCLKVEYIKLNNAIALEMKNISIKHEALFVKIIRNLITIIISKSIVGWMIDELKEGGYKMFLTDDYDKPIGDMFQISADELNAMLTVIDTITAKIGKGVNIEYSASICGGIRSIFDKMTDARTIYPACFYAGIDLRKNSEAMNEQHRQLIDSIICQEVPRYTTSKEFAQKKEVEKLESDFRESVLNKGWSLK